MNGKEDAWLLCDGNALISNSLRRDQFNLSLCVADRRIFYKFDFFFEDDFFFRSEKEVLGALLKLYLWTSLSKSFIPQIYAIVKRLVKFPYPVCTGVYIYNELLKTNASWTSLGSLLCTRNERVATIFLNTFVQIYIWCYVRGNIDEKETAFIVCHSHYTRQILVLHIYIFIVSTCCFRNFCGHAAFTLSLVYVDFYSALKHGHLTKTHYPPMKATLVSTISTNYWYWKQVQPTDRPIFYSEKLRKTKD